MSLLKIALGAAGFASTVAAHGFVKGVNCNGKEYVLCKYLSRNHPLPLDPRKSLSVAFCYGFAVRALFQKQRTSPCNILCVPNEFA